MQIVNDSLKKQVLEHYPEKYHKLLSIQISVINKLIEDNFMKYQYSSDFRKAIDLLLTELLNGKLLGRELNEN